MAWQIDAGHSSIEFSARHMLISKTRGKFTKFSGTVELDEANPANSSVDIQIDAASIDTGLADRDNHLRSPDFLTVAEFPTLNFKSNRVVVNGENAKLHGDLTIRDVTHPIVLDVEYVGKTKSPWGTTVAGFNGKTKFNRKDWGLVWNVALETGGLLVGEEITVEIELELIQQ